MPTGLPRKPPTLWEMTKALAQILWIRLRLWFAFCHRRRRP
jgi:hypothetical protein